MKAPEIRIFDTLEALYDMAAARVITSGREATKERGKFLLMISGGGTPRPLYRRLGQAPDSREAFWHHTHFFWADERLVPPDDDESNYGQVRRILLDEIDTPESNIHRARGELGLAQAATDYTDQLVRYADPGLEWPRFDLALLGMGRDGHTASLFPAAEAAAYDKPVVAVSATYGARPAARISLTPLVFNEAREVLFIVTGASKADAVVATLQGPLAAIEYPAQRIQPPKGRVSWFLDREAATALDWDEKNIIIVR